MPQSLILMMPLLTMYANVMGILGGFVVGVTMLDIGAVLASTEHRSTIVPRPHPELVTRRVLVMERLDGFAWDDAAGMRDAGVDTVKVLHDGLVSFMEGAMLAILFMNMFAPFIDHFFVQANIKRRLARNAAAQ